MAIRRVKTQGSRLGVFNLEDYEFDTGLLGVCQRLRVSSRNAVVRSYRGFRFIMTSFLGLHYIYIIAWSFVLSWILYPQKNMSYTDALFQGVSAMTLTGLNTVDLNELKTYQQVFLFVTPVCTHPLTVATFMVFYRLYLYRCKFDDIEETSKSQSKLRRAATISQYESTKHGAYGAGQHQPPQAINLQLGKPQRSPLANHILAQRQQQQGGVHQGGLHQSGLQQGGLHQGSLQQDGGGDVVDEQVEEYDDPDEKPAQDATSESSYRKDSVSPGSSESTEDDSGVAQHAPHDGDETEDGGNKIRFGDLPRPPSRDRQNDPQEMYRSLYMMRNQNLGEDLDEDDGPALVIKSPRDIEADERRGIHSAVANGDDAAQAHPRSPDRADISFSQGPQHRVRRSSTATYAADARSQRSLSRADTLMSIASNRNPRSMAANYLSWTPTVGRNSAFIGLSREQKEELGGVEYRSLKLLRWITISYFLITLTLGWLFLIPWVYKQQRYEDIIRQHGVSPVMFAMTTVLSGFNNSGLCVLPTSLAEFWHSAYVPVIVSFLVMFGNVAAPIILRAIVFSMFHLSPRFGQSRETLGFLLDHPRRCFMLLFPSTTTWWLVLTIVVFIITEVSFFMILDANTHSPQPDLAAGPRLLFAYFQSIAVRTVGFTMVNIGGQAPGMLVLNIVMMYVAIYPVAMSIRKSNVYEEQTLRHYHTGASRWTDPTFSDTRSVSSNAIDDDDNDNDNDDQRDENNGGGAGANNTQRSLFRDRLRRMSNLTGAWQNGNEELNEEDPPEEDEDDNPSTLIDHMRRQLSMDIWSLVLGLMLVCITEGGRITRGDFSMFGVIFEVVSAHGTIGWSLGAKDSTASLCGGFSNLGKLVMMAIMIRGRHRAMPYNVDRAIILKGADLTKRDQKQENRARDARIMTHQEPSESSQWFPRIASTASRLHNFGTMRQRPTTSRQNSMRSTVLARHHDEA